MDPKEWKQQMEKVKYRPEFPWFLMNCYFLMTDDNSMAFRQEHQYTHKDSHPVTEAFTTVWSESLLILFLLQALSAAMERNQRSSKSYDTGGK
jgi:hypothetical protein